MTTADVRPAAHRLERRGVRALIERLESGFGSQPRSRAALANQQLLAALDRGEHDRFAIWPARDPVATVYLSPSGTLVPAGDPAAGQPLAEHVEGSGWRVLIGDAAIADSLLDAFAHGWFRRQPDAREQRFMCCEHAVDAGPLRGLRKASYDDLEAVTELACQLHVEDQMGPPLSRSGRAAVRRRMRTSIDRDETWVVERGGAVIAKVDVSLNSPSRGAQLAGVFVARESREQGIGARAIAAVTTKLLGSGLPGVTLHVRADNAAARTAYEHAGFTDRGPWTLALR